MVLIKNSTKHTRRQIARKDWLGLQFTYWKTEGVTPADKRVGVFKSTVTQNSCLQRKHRKHRTRLAHVWHSILILYEPCTPNKHKKTLKRVRTFNHGERKLYLRLTLPRSFVGGHGHDRGLGRRVVRGGASTSPAGATGGRWRG